MRTRSQKAQGPDAEQDDAPTDAGERSPLSPAADSNTAAALGAQRADDMRSRSPSPVSEEEPRDMTQLLPREVIDTMLKLFDKEQDANSLRHLSQTNRFWQKMINPDRLGRLDLTKLLLTVPPMRVLRLAQALPGMARWAKSIFLTSPTDTSSASANVVPRAAAALSAADFGDAVLRIATPWKNASTTLDAILKQLGPLRYAAATVLRGAGKTAISNETFALALSYSNIVILRFDSVKITSAAFLDVLASMPKLKALSLIETEVSIALRPKEEIPEMPCLRYLSCRSASGPADLVDSLLIRCASTLQGLVLEAGAGGSTQCYAIGSLQALDFIILGGIWRSAPALRALRGCTAEELRFRSEGLEEQTIDSLGLLLQQSDRFWPSLTKVGTVARRPQGGVWSRLEEALKDESSIWSRRGIAFASSRKEVKSLYRWTFLASDDCLDDVVDLSDDEDHVEEDTADQSGEGNLTNAD